jgi:hypothetical protein
MHSSQQIWNNIKFGRQNDRVHKYMSLVHFGINAVNIIFSSKKYVITILNEKTSCYCMMYMKSRSPIEIQTQHWLEPHLGSKIHEPRHPQIKSFP